MCVATYYYSCALLSHRPIDACDYLTLPYRILDVVGSRCPIGSMIPVLIKANNSFCISHPSVLDSNNILPWAVGGAGGLGGWYRSPGRQ